MARAPSNRTKANTACTICCQLSETSFDSCGTVASEICTSEIWVSEIKGSDMGGGGRLVFQVTFLSAPCQAKPLGTEDRETLSSPVLRGFSTVRKMMYRRFPEVSNLAADALSSSKPRGASSQFKAAKDVT